MTVLALPYGSRVAIGALLADLDALLTAEGHTDFVVGNNVGTDVTHDTYPFVRVSQVGGSLAEPESIYWLASSAEMMTGSLVDLDFGIHLNAT